jgi:UDP-N-acetylglucosamine 2-epimerase (non-hydrolysing)
MPEEINRILTDQISDLCLTPSRDGDANLLAEGIPANRIVFVGNVMIDSLLYALEEVRDTPLPVSNLRRGEYVVVTLHRPSNVDDERQLREIVGALETIAEKVDVVFPVHPRTAACMKSFGLDLRRVRSCPPLGYKDMLALQASAGAVLTDSGGIQEETTVLGVPCLTLRSTTERPITIEQGTNRLVPVRSHAAIVGAFEEVWGRGGTPRRPEGWDGRAAERIAEALHSRLHL